MTFPILLSNGPPEAGLTEVAEAGVTMVRTGRGDWSAAQADAQIAAERARLDTLHAHGLRAWVWLGSLQNLPPGAPSPQRELLTRVVEDLRDHPALGAWKGHDEPHNPFKPKLSVPPANLERGLRAIKALDPEHPVVVIQAPRGAVDAITPYRKSFDIGGVDIYPVSYPPGTHTDERNKDISVVGDLTQWIRAAAGTKPVWLTLQVAWSGVLPPHVPRFPSNAELRFMAFQAIVNGARGLSFFGGHLPQVMTPADGQAGWNWTFWRQSLQPLVQQLASTALAPALVASAARLTVRASSKDVELATRHTPQFTYLLAVRRGGATSRVQFTGLPKSLRGGQVLFEYANGEFRSVSLVGGAFTDWFAPHDVRIYRFSR